MSFRNDVFSMHIDEKKIQILKNYYFALSHSITSITFTVNFITVQYRVDYLPENVKTWCEDEKNICKDKQNKRCQAS